MGTIRARVQAVRDRFSRSHESDSERAAARARKAEIAARRREQKQRDELEGAKHARGGGGG